MDITTPPSTAASPAATTGTPAVADAPRWPYAGHGQQTLLWASVLITVGAFLPWLMTGVGTFTGMRGAGSWTVFAGVIGLGVSLVRSRRVVLAHAIGIAAIAIVLPGWQLIHTIGLVGFRGWLPGIGLIMTLGGGIVIAGAAREIHADR